MYNVVKIMKVEENLYDLCTFTIYIMKKKMWKTDIIYCFKGLILY